MGSLGSCPTCLVMSCRVVPISIDQISHWPARIGEGPAAPRPRAEGGGCAAPVEIALSILSRRRHRPVQGFRPHARRILPSSASCYYYYGIVVAGSPLASHASPSEQSCIKTLIIVSVDAAPVLEWRSLPAMPTPDSHPHQVNCHPTEMKERMLCVPWNRIMTYVIALARHSKSSVCAVVILGYGTRPICY